MTRRDPDSRERHSDQTLRARCAYALVVARRALHLRKENWYRDVWLFVISGILLWSVAIAQNTASNANNAAHQAKTLGIENSKLADETKKLATTIQNERRNSITRSCMDQNTRHDNTVKQLYKEIRYYKTHLHPGQTQATLDKSARQTVALIDALSPRQNCRLVVAQSTTPSNAS